MKTKLLFVLMISFLLGASSLSSQSNAYKLAVLEKGGYVSEDDLLVKRFNYLLIQVNNQYEESQQQICDMTYKMKEMALGSGIKLSMEKAMEGAMQVRGKSYTNYCARYITLMQKGYKHDEIISTLKLL
ncbi:MAG TPA: hypothetical protein VIK55_08010 [Paludibacter sp.]